MRRRWAQAAFSLIEMLMVMAVVAIISALVVPASTSMMLSSRLTSSSDQLVATLGLARQTAIARNRPVEVRFYQYADAEVPGEVGGSADSGKFRAFQTFELLESGAVVALSKVEQLPDGIIFDKGVESTTSLSTLLGNSRNKDFTASSALDPKVIIPRVGTSYNCRYFRISPDGSTGLEIKNWFVTLHRLKDGDALLTPPPNFATVQVDAVSGAVKVYRP
jgi:uncharacterized protein (TIGR02596 family)